MKSSGGFTLIELLVVITIIVVLLALLAPALDKALSEAEMAKCMANLKAISTGGTTYAMGYKRYYPAPVQVSAVYWSALIGATDGGYPGDRRKAWKEALGSINAPFQCPLLDAGLDFETTQSDHISANYEILAGWGYDGNPGLRRVGDKLVFNDTTSPQPKVQRYDVMASDRNLIQTFADAQSSHPDVDGKLVFTRRQDGPDPWGSPLVKTTTSLWWSNFGGSDRGMVDSNFAATDGSVQRINQIEWDHDESEMNRAPVWQAPAANWREAAWMFMPAN